MFDAIASGEGDPHTPASVLGLGTPVLPPLPMHGGDRNRTSPFAFTGNKFEFRALGSSMSLAFPNTGAEHDRRRGDRRAGRQARVRALIRRRDLAEAVNAVVKDAYTESKRVIFGGDNYAEEWHAEAERRGLKNLRTTPDALPEVLSDQTVAAFEKYEVLSHRELESRFEVWSEQYTMRAQHRGRDRREHGPDDAAAGRAAPRGAGRGRGHGRRWPSRRGARRRVRRGDRRARGGQRYPDGVEGLDLRSTPATTR